MKKTVELSPTNPALFTRFPSIWDDLMTGDGILDEKSGLSVWEDEKTFCVEAAVPGIDPSNVTIELDNDILRISGEAEEERKEKRYYRKATSSFNYHIALPGVVDSRVEPVAECKKGVLTVKFSKTPQAKPKKIAVKG